MRTTKKQLAQTYSILDQYREWLAYHKNTEDYIKALNNRENVDPKEIEREINRYTLQEWQARIDRELETLMSPSYREDVPQEIQKLKKAIDKIEKRLGKEQDNINKTHIKAVAEKMYEVVPRQYHIDEIGHSVVSMHYKKAYWYGKLNLRCNNYTDNFTYAVKVGDTELDNSIYPEQKEAIEKSFEAALKLYRRPDVVKEVSDILLARVEMLATAENIAELEINDKKNQAIKILQDRANNFYESIKDRIK